MSGSIMAQQALNPLPDDWENSLRSACERIAPVWPLDQWIAVNPFWGLKHLPAHWADSVLSQRGGFSILPAKNFYRVAWDDQRITEADLQASLAEHNALTDCDQLLRWLDQPAESPRAGLGSLLYSYNSPAGTDSAVEAVSHQIAKICAGFFDQRQAGWSPAPETDSLYHFWLAESRTDLSLDVQTGVDGARKFLKTLPADTHKAAILAVEKLGLGGVELEALAHRCLLQVNGWASWCRGEDWRADLDGRSSDRLWELLVITLIWELIGLECASNDQRARWLKQRPSARRIAQPSSRQWIWHRAYEIGYQRELWRSLSGHSDEKEAPSEVNAPAFQAVFCIDVRSEVMRRHLETACPQSQTLGFAGFFGLAVEHHRHGPFEPVRRLPGLLPAPYLVVDSHGSQAADQQANRTLDQQEIARGAVRSAQNGSLSTFTLVETTGLAWAWKLIRDSLKRPSGQSSPPAPEERLVHRASGDPLTDADKAGMVANMLRGMSLTEGFAPLVVFVGHGSRTNNNPHHAGLECGACGGQSGATNARLAAHLFNQRPVRAKLAELGIRIPDFVWAVAAEHCTLTDQVSILDDASVPETHLVRLSEMKRAFVQAGVSSRRERAAAMGLQDLGDESLMERMNQRGNDWAEVRPEWGLANNAAIIFAKRSKTRGVDLGGRVFLHDYDPDLDPTGGVLEILMTAPMVVANWINLQYFSSVATPEVYGGGNKLLHSVVGGNVGVIEGNSPHLRIGLPLQSVHDGEKWRHEPLRLTVLIDASVDRIEEVLQKHGHVAELVENHWLHLCRLSGDGIEHYREGRWERVVQDQGGTNC